ncbi:MAG TPA: diaminopimelate decarboxylase [Candidatus Desulfovibrio intestinipullorum]|uniref:Diaminopimelate decarboxylase n=1 Tax=Candidatus Desulfovibrio intestinipullorum TaxID=2838536 RepID=A0A9D1TPC6_9BACT|nr:diaminopimelate decarboxylase [Candidatus Desulfovibrio intestinipullorum]
MQLAEELGTPLYVYEKDAILAQLARLKRTFPGVTILYSLKCNPFEPVCRLLAGRTCGFDAASPGEVHKALASGQTPDNILYSAPGKSLDDLQRTFDRCTLIADSLSELHRLNALASAAGKILTVGLRISPSLALGPGARPDIVQALPDKFGVDEERLPELAREFQSLTSLHLAGLHVHVRSQVLSAQALTAIFTHVARLARFWVQELHRPLAFLNLGGGLGIPNALEEGLDLDELGCQTGRLVASLQDLCRQESGGPLRLFVESGRFLVGRAGSFVTRITDVKTSRGTTFACAPGLMNHYLRICLARLMNDLPLPDNFAGPLEPLWSGPGLALPLVLGAPAPVQRVTLCGTLCTAQDIALRDVLLPGILPGNLLVFPNAGAYAAALSPHGFAGHEAHGEVLV